MSHEEYTYDPIPRMSNEKMSAELAALRAQVAALSAENAQQAQGLRDLAEASLDLVEAHTAKVAELQQELDHVKKHRDKAMSDLEDATRAHAPQPLKKATCAVCGHVTDVRVLDDVPTCFECAQSGDDPPSE